jgi:hypothetical protein
MEKKAFIILLCFLNTLCFSQNISDSHTGNMEAGNKNKTVKNSFRIVQNEAFRKGEVLEYRVHYGFIDAGTARLEIREEEKKIGGRKVYHAIGTGKSHWTFDWFFKVRDRYESYIDEEGIFPWIFIRRVDEGGYVIKQDYAFFQNKDTVDNGAGKRFAVPHGIQDMFSAFYFGRTIDFSSAKEGDIFSIDAFIDDSVWTGKLKFIGTETVEIGLGKFNCLKFAPIVQKGRIFKKEEDLTLYITNDKNKIPILAEAKILVGSIKMELQNYSGLANPISKTD